MTQDADQKIATVIKEMIQKCEEIYSLLKLDVDLFGKNSFSALEVSNQKKSELMTALAILANRLGDICPQGIAKAIETSPLHDEITGLVQTLNTIVKECNEYVVANGQVVFSNLEMLRDVWSRVAARSSSNIYDESGKIINY